MALVFAFRPVKLHSQVAPARTHASARIEKAVPIPVPVVPKPVPAVSKPAVLTFPKGEGKIAIVLDDWGYNLKQVQALTHLSQPVTVAVLPNLPFSAEVAQQARGAGHEVILHMPMEALNPQVPKESVTLLTGMPRQEVLQRLQKSLKSVPSAQGISNHQGSKATTDRQFMKIVLGEVKRKRLFFLDSFVTENSVCQEVAHQMKVRFARRTVFLDNDLAPSAIRERFMELARIAAQEGQAIGIGHDRPNTLEVLKEALPTLKEAGYTLVSASELAQETR